MESKLGEVEQQLADAMAKADAAEAEHASAVEELKGELQTASGKQQELESAMAQRMEELNEAVPRWVSWRVHWLR